jgi:hypothetical protein
MHKLECTQRSEPLQILAASHPAQVIENNDFLPTLDAVAGQVSAQETATTGD